MDMTAVTAGGTGAAEARPTEARIAGTGTDAGAGPVGDRAQPHMGCLGCDQGHHRGSKRRRDDGQGAARRHAGQHRRRRPRRAVARRLGTGTRRRRPRSALAARSRRRVRRPTAARRVPRRGAVGGDRVSGQDRAAGAVPLRRHDRGLPARPGGAGAVDAAHQPADRRRRGTRQDDRGRAGYAGADAAAPATPASHGTTASVRTTGGVDASGERSPSAGSALDDELYFLYVADSDVDQRVAENWGQLSMLTAFPEAQAKISPGQDAAARARGVSRASRCRWRAGCRFALA
jgi:hypothetical protein